MALKTCIPFWYWNREGLLEKWELLEIPNKILHFVFWDELQKPSGGMQRCISHRPVSILLLSHQQPKILFFYSEYLLISIISSNLNIAFTPAAQNIVSLDIFKFWIYKIHVGFLINMQFADTCPFFYRGLIYLWDLLLWLLKAVSKKKSCRRDHTE